MITSSARAGKVGGIVNSRLGGRQIDDEIGLSRLLDWNVGGFCPVQNFVRDLCGTASAGTDRGELFFMAPLPPRSK